MGGAGCLSLRENIPFSENSPYVGTIYKSLVSYPVLGKILAASFNAALLTLIFLLYVASISFKLSAVSNSQYNAFGGVIPIGTSIFEI